MENEVKNTEGASASDAGIKPVEKVDDSKVAEILEASAQKIKELEDERTKLTEERENYRDGMLSAKKKIKALREQGYDVQEKEEPQFDADDLVERVVERLKPIIKPQEIDSLNTKISELATALKNRSQINNQGSGGSQEELNSIKKEFFTPEQLVDLKARGLDPAKVKENMLKQKAKTV